MQRKPYHTVGLGGTFDRFHLGHEAFLTFAAQHADHLAIGITTTKMTLGKPLSESIQPIKQRMARVAAWCNKLGVQYDLFELTDAYGPSLEGGTLDALVVTEETEAGATAINQARAGLGLQPLPVHVCTMVRDQLGEVLHSSQIRRGVADQAGTRFDALLANDLGPLTPAHKTALRTLPYQTISEYSELHQSDIHLRVVVGDVCTNLFVEHDWPFAIAIIDGRVEREPIDQPLLEQTQFQATNPAGTISTALTQAVLAATDRAITDREPLLIGIDGEEDLAALVAVLTLPTQSQVFFGVPQLGMARYTVSEKLKHHALAKITQTC